MILHDEFLHIRVFEQLAMAQTILERQILVPGTEGIGRNSTPYAS